MKKFIFLLLGFNVLVNSVLNSFITIDSDVVWPYLLLPHLFKNMVYLASDTFILHYPVSYLITRFVGLNATAVFLDSFVLVISTIIGWLVFYFYFLKKYLSAVKIIYFLPAFLFINFSKTFYQIISIPSLRNIEFAIALLASIYFDNYLSLRSKKLLKFGVLFTMLLLFISDPYFIYVFAAPLLVILLIKSFINSRYWNITVWVSIAIAANTVVRYLLNKTQFFTLSEVSNAHIVSIHKIGSNIDLTIKSILRIFDSYPNLHLFSFLYLAVFLLGIYGLWLMFRKGLNDKKHIMQLLLPLCFVFTILAYISSGQPTNIETYRYLIFIVFIIPFGVCYALSRLSWKYAGISVALGLVVLLAANIIRIDSGFNSSSSLQQYEKNQIIIKAVRENGLRYGYTSYWSAGINTFLSGNKSQFIQVSCVNRRIRAFTWLASESWFDSSSYRGKTFLLIDYLGSLTPEIKMCDLNDVTKQFGKPAQIVPVTYANETLSLIIFDYNIAEKFDTD